MIERLNTALAGRYLVERELGEGGMAIVFLAEDLRHHRKVALKVLKPELAAFVGAERFLAEIETTARLQHPNILPLFDSGEAGDFLFYVMPYVEGESVRAWLDRDRQLPIDDAVRIAGETAEALHAAHLQGVVHRDIKPANILLSQGRPLVADFGIALAVRAAGGRRLTETGLSIGTPQYMSPEQAMGDGTIGPASDVYALGCVLYEMLVGEPPYTGGTVQAILGKVITSEPESVTAQRRAVPPHVDAVVARALEKLPADRFGSAADFARALSDEGFRHGAGRAVVTSARMRTLAYLGWAVAAVVAAVGLPSLFRTEAPPAVRRLSLVPPEGVGASEYLALTPDGSALLMVNQRDGGVTVQRLDDVAHLSIAGGHDGRELMVSPDGERVAIPTGNGLQVASVTGGSPRTLVPDGSICCVRWGEEQEVYFTNLDEGAIYRVPEVGGEPQLVVEGEDPGVVVSSYYELLPGGDRAVFSHVTLGVSNEVVVIDTRTGRREVLTQGARPFVTREGHLLFVREDGGLYAAPLDAKGMRLAGPPILMAEGVGVMGGGVDAMYTYARSGDLAYWVPPRAETREVRDLIWVDRAGRVTPVDSTWQGEWQTVDLSPDRTMVAVTLGANDDDTEVWIRDLEQGTARRVTSHEGMNRRPVWSPDGTTLAFISRWEGRRAAFSLPVEGIASPELLLALPDDDVDEVAWSPDGDWLLYRTGTTTGDRDLYAHRLRPDTTTVVVSAQPGVDERAPVLSPNGRWVAYVSDEAGEEAVWVRPFPEVQRGSRQVSPELGLVPAWSSKGDELFFRARPGFTSLKVETEGEFASGAARVLFPNRLSLINTVYRTFDYDASRDRFLMIRRLGEEAAAPRLILVENFLEDVKARLEAATSTR